MFTKRIIPCLDVNNGRVVKGVNFVDLKDAGDPVTVGAAYGKAGADELVFLDITASSDARATKIDMVRRVAETVFIPFTVGGGIRTVDDFKAVLREGADKVAVNSAAILNPELISEAAMKFGSQCVVVAIDAKRREDGKGWNIFKNGGRVDMGIDAIEWAMKAYELGAGEILLTSMDCDGTKDGYMNYRDIAHELAEYVSDMGYTHVELMGIAEYPFDGSWGYQVTGYYAPTARYGTPKDFMYFVDYMHKKGIGVILDWVPAHFPKDAHGLANFDGSCVYEYADPRKGEHPDWGTKVFDYSKNEVSNFLIANGMYWVDKFHVDGLRVDAVASMLYLDYGRTEGNWVPNKYGGNGNLEAMSFLKHFNSMMKKRFPQAVTIAEESTAWPNVSGDPDNGDCLGFTFKWNMGWMHDFTEYMKLDPYFRKFNHGKLTFSLMYAYSENFILVLSHDEVVHLKCSMLGKMPGDKDDKFSNLKLAYAYMCGHPGKKLLFMGQEFGQWNEWSEERELDWYLLDDESHKQMKDFTKKCMLLYKNYRCLYETDYRPEGFRWINANDKDNSVYSFIRISPDNNKHLLFVLSFTPVERNKFRIGAPLKGKYKLVLGSNEDIQKKTLTAVKGDCDGYKQSLLIDLPAYGIAVYEFSGDLGIDD